VKSENYPHAQENEADDLIPQGVQGLDDGGHNVPHEMRAHADCLVFPHALIVTNGWMGNLPLLASRRTADREYWVRL
jgi:hypothetical protein